MGLHHTAHYLKAQGRDKDTELVHMSPKEVKGLQELAKANCKLAACPALWCSHFLGSPQAVYKPKQL